MLWVDMLVDAGGWTCLESLGSEKKTGREPPECRGETLRDAYTGVYYFPVTGEVFTLTAMANE